MDVRDAKDPASHVFAFVPANRGLRIVGVAPGAFEIQASNGRRGFVRRDQVTAVFASEAALPSGPVPGLVSWVP